MTYEENLERLSELLPEKQWAARRWLKDSYDEGKDFDILEVYRTHERQNDLFAKGRWKPGPIVTYTLKSKHTDRLAVDIKPVKGTYENIAEVAARYGITHPFTEGFRDLPHFEFDKVGAEPMEFSPSATMKRLQRAIERATGIIRTILSNQLARLLSRLL